MPEEPNSALRPLVAQDLDSVECENPSCVGDHPLFIHQTCHPGEGVDACYVGDILSLSCHRCRKPIMKIRVERAQVQ